jgi:hypothetical protein
MGGEIGNLKKDISYLASDALEGRRTGTPGEEMARQYLEKRYEQMGVPAWKTAYGHPFSFDKGKRMGPKTRLTLAGIKYASGSPMFPMPWSGNGEVKSFTVLPLFEKAEDAGNPHFDWNESAHTRAKDAQKGGATGVVFWAPPTTSDLVQFRTKSEDENIDIPVAVVFATEAPKPRAGEELKVELEKEIGTAYNVAAYLDAGAPYTIVIGAHYDHLGHGEDGNSLQANAAKRGEVHNGADDNASGTAGLLLLAQRLKAAGKRNYNYLFVHFSGEELGLLGSKAFAKAFNLDSTNTAAMINMDMIGRLSDSSRALTVGGWGTSPVWASMLPLKATSTSGATASSTTTTWMSAMPNTNFKIALDSAGIGPSDHTSFYTHGIPVLFFFTGVHTDYHKPSDDADKINYKGEWEVLNLIDSVVTRLDAQPKPRFTVTKQNVAGKVRFKVTLGIMPDYAFNEGGVRVEDVSDDRPAARAGVQAGDILLELGAYKIGGMQSYMEALSKLKSGDTVPLKLRRGTKEKTVDVTL